MAGAQQKQVKSLAPMKPDRIHTFSVIFSRVTCMFIKISTPNGSTSYLWLPIYFYNESHSLRVFISIIELLLYILCFYIVTINLKVFLTIRMFHQNLIILAIPMFGLWYELVFGKLIVMAHQLHIINVGLEIDQFFVLWTDNIEKMLEIEEIDGLELLLLSAFLHWHYMLSIIFGGLAVCAERVFASMLINNYEKSSQLFIPFSLTLFAQTASFSGSYLIMTNRIGIFTVAAVWVTVCPFGLAGYFVTKKLNEDWQREMESPQRKVVFTVSQRFQVKENLRALRLAKRSVFAVVGTVVVCGIGIFLSIFELIPPTMCHLVENCIILNPYIICFVVMFSLPAWKKEFLRYLFCFFVSKQQCSQNQSNQTENIHPVKRVSIETAIYFEQLNKSWI